MHRDDRFGEKLATPDTSIADLIGEVDPIKVAEGRYLSDELTLHYGLVPRTNRGIFAVNELPDLAERIQVGLLNVLEERDIQVRGYQIRLPLDVLLVASANPEDYTNRGRLITPLKDRFGIADPHPLPARRRDRARDHGPGGPVLDSPHPDGPAVEVAVPDYLGEVDRHPQPARPGQLPRQPAQRGERAHVGHQPRGGGRQRAAARAAGRRDGAVPRVDDLDAMAASSGGKIEIESLDDSGEGAVFDNLVRGAVLTVFKERVAPELTPAPSSAPSRRARSPTPARTCRRPSSPRSSSTIPALRAAGRRAHRRRRVAGGRGRGRGVRPRGPAPVQAAEQGHVVGRLGPPLDVPRPLTAPADRTR